MQKAVLLAGGKGTRMYPLTQYIPKALLPIGMKPSIQLIAEEAILAGAKKICFVVAPNSGVREYFEGCCKEIETCRGIELVFVTQNKPLGSGNALLCAEEFCQKEKFFLANCDEVFSQNSFSQLLEANNIAVAIKRVKASQCGLYGIVDCQQGFAKNVQEKPDKISGSFGDALVGRFLLDGRIFDCLRHVSFVNGEQRLTDALKILFSQNKVSAVSLKGERFDVGNPSGYQSAFCYFSLRKKR